MAYADQLARVSSVKTSLARDFIAAKERGFIELPTDKYFVQAAEVRKSILDEYDQSRNVYLLDLVAELMRVQSDAMQHLMQLPKAAPRSANERGWHNFLESSEQMPAIDV
jgi:hypothetical protein